MNMLACLRHACAVSTLVVALAATPSSRAGVYTFTRIAESPNDIIVPGGAPTINNHGQVAFDGQVMSPPSLIVTPISPQIMRGDGGPLTVIASQASSVSPSLVGFTPSAYAINDAGQVAFGAYHNGPGSGVYLSDGTTIVELSDNTDPNIYPAINQSGTLAWRMSTPTGGGIFYGTIGPILVIEAGATHSYLALGNPDINSHSTMAFRVQDHSPGGGAFGEERIFASTPGAGTFEVTSTSTGGWATTGGAIADNVVIGDSGGIAFQAIKQADGSQGVYLAIPGPTGYVISTVADTNGPFASFAFNAIEGLSINEHNEVAFRATLDGSGTIGIYTGPDPVADKIVEVGDTIDGKVVASLEFGRFGINHDGEIAFFVNFSGGGSAVYRATPTYDFGPVMRHSYLLRSDAAPTDPDHAMFKTLRPPMINGNGKISFKSALFPRDPTDGDPNPITSANDLAIFADKGSIPLALIAREGSVAPGAGAATFHNLSDPVQSDAGEVAFKAQLKTGGGVTAANNEVIYSDAPGTLTKVARKGENIASLGTTAAWKTFSSVAVVNGGCFGVATLSGVPATSDQVFWAWEADDAAPRFPLKEGDPIDFGTAGTRTVKSVELLFARPGVGGQGISYNRGDNGEVAWARVSLVGGGVALMKFTTTTDLFDTKTIGPKFLSKSGLLPAVADPAPGVANAIYGAIGYPATNARGRIAFVGALKTRPMPPPAITGNDDTVLWAGPSDSLAIVKREGDDAPGVTSGKFTAFGDPVLDDNNRLAFLGKLRSGSGITGANDQGIWATTGEGLKLIAREGVTQSFLPANTVIQSFSSVAINQRGGLFKAKLRVGTGGVTAGRDEVLVLWRGADGSATVVFRERQLLEVMPGHVRRLLTFDIITQTPTPTAGVGRSFNSRGQAMAYCTFLDGTTGFIGIDL